LVSPRSWVHSPALSALVGLSDRHRPAAPPWFRRPHSHEMGIRMVDVGVVVIGRNEGERLKRCLEGLRGARWPVLYVDSLSHDGSPAWARGEGFTVVELDGSSPLSAARARNEGFRALLADHPELEFVQFVDGDCELFPDWIERGREAFRTRPEAGIVCGQVVERHPEASLYNLMCSVEWQKPPGEILACGGIFMVRAAVFRALDGFRADVMAAEDDELCLRVRRSGRKIIAVAEPMVLHDAALSSFGQWWTRARRTGMAYGQGVFLHGNSADQHFRRQARSALFWGAGVPLVALGLALPTRGLSLVALSAYLALFAKIYRAHRRNGQSHRVALVLATFNVIAKWPELQGLGHFYHRILWQGGAVELIEYKGLQHEGSDTTPPHRAKR
jgi:glycosyltransferase involved in cell wall biosynthesis